MNKQKAMEKWICAADSLPKDDVYVVWISDAPLRVPFIGAVVKHALCDDLTIISMYHDLHNCDALKIKESDMRHWYWLQLPAYPPADKDWLANFHKT